MKFRFMMGVLPGYGHENEDLTPESAFRIGNEEVQNAFEDGQVDVKLAAAVYSKNFGCPTGGELGVQVSGEYSSDEERENILNSIKGMMGNLGQNTVTVEFFDDAEKILGSAYISEGGKEVAYNDAKDIEHFSAKIPADGIDLLKLGEKFQDALAKAKNDGKYMTSGNLTCGKDEKGNKYYEYSGTQNPDYGQTNKELYREVVCETVETATKDLGKNIPINFNDTQKIVGNPKKTIVAKPKKTKDNDDYDEI